MIVQQLITIMVNIMSTIMMGQFGEAAISATALANQHYNLFYVACMGLSAGAAVLVAQFWGKNDVHSIRVVCSIMFKLIAIVGIIFVSVSLLFPRQTMLIYTNEESVISEGSKYLRLIAIAFIFHTVTISCTNMLRCAGVVKLPMIGSIISLVTTVFFNWVFIFGNLGAPRMGIVGAGIGILTARILEGVIVGGYALFFDKKIGFRIRHLVLFDMKLLKNYFATGGPVLASDFFTVLGSNMISVIMGHLGSSFTAAVSIVTIFTQISTILCHGVAGPSSIITGNTVGRGENEKAYIQGRTFICLGAICGMLACGVILLLKSPFIGLYNIEESTKAIAGQLITIAAFIVIFNVQDGILSKGILRGGGDTKVLMAIDLLCVWGVAVPLGYLTAFRWGAPIWLVYVCLRSETVLKACVCFCRFLTKRWIHDVTSAKTENI